MLLNLKKGDAVKLQANGESITRRVWEVDSERVYLCTEEAYQKSLKEGKKPLVGFARKDEVQIVG